MMTRIGRSSLASMARTLVVSTALIAALASSALAGAEQNYGSQWAWDNNFNNSNIGISFGTGSTPNFTVSYNFGSYSLYGYPANIRGWHYGWNPTGDTTFPKKVSSISSSNCTFNYSSGGSNMAGDFAYDIFLRNDSAKSTPQLEIMIWGGNDSWPIGTLQKSNVLSAGGWTYDLWEGFNSSAGYETLTFIPHGTAGVGNLPTSGSVNVNLKTFYNYLATNASQYFKNTQYVDVVECGLEITRGNGWAWMGANIAS